MPGEQQQTLADRLRAARARQFVGRAEELALFAQALDADVAPFALLWLHGSGGIGKSTLLKRFADDAGTRPGCRVRLVDAARLEPSPRAFAAAVGEVPTGTRLVVLLDGAEALAPLGTWLREEYLPTLPADAVVVLAGRSAPDERWRTDLGWAEHLRVVALGGLAPAEAATYLGGRGVPADQVGAVVEGAAGHPLALALAADVVGQNPGMPAVASAHSVLTSAGLVDELLARFVGDVAEPDHRRALHLLGHVRTTTQPLLAAALDIPTAAAAECFDWLRGLSFVQVGGRGALVPHDLARAVLDADLRRRDPDGRRALRAAVLQAYVRQARDGDAPTRRRAVADLLWLNRNSPSLAAYPSWEDAFSLWWEQAGPQDLPQILALVARYEGQESVELHEKWWAAQPEAFVVIRERPGQVHGFLLMPKVMPRSDEHLDVPHDPFVRAAADHVGRTAPLRPGEHLRVVRSWMAVEGYHVPSPTHQALTGATTAAWLSEPGLAVSVAYMAAGDPGEPGDPGGGEGDLWGPMFAHVDYAPAREAAVVAFGRSYSAYVHDWRARPPLEWLALVTERADSREAVSAAPQEPVRGGVLSREQFDACVRNALKNATDPRTLAASPLLGCRVVRDQAAPGEPTAADVRAVLTDAVARLRTRPRGDRDARVLEVTYFARAATQEAAAARLAMPFSTYRRALGSGLAAVVEDLWDRELRGGVERA